MLFPRNVEKQREFLYTFETNKLVAQYESCSNADADALRCIENVHAAINEVSSTIKEVARDNLLNAAMRPVAQTTKGREPFPPAGCLAGATLLIPLILARSFPERPKVGTGYAYDKIHNEYKLSKRTLQTNWAAFGSVSHLWAVFQIYGCLPSRENFKEYIAIARNVRNEALTHVPVRAKEPILRADRSLELEAILPDACENLAEMDWFRRMELNAALRLAQVTDA
jgi:hypothetical protein